MLALGFASEYVFVLKMLLAFAAAGGFVLLPFRRSLRFGLLAAPFAGLLSVSLGIAAFYGVGGLTVAQAMIVSWSACVATTVLALAISRPKVRWSDLIGMIACMAVIAAIVTRSTDAASIRLHDRALLYCDGTDHLGYVQVADWVNAHPVSAPPDASAESPCNAWLTVLFRIDPRFGSYFYLAMIAAIRHVAAAFAYDAACAVCLSAAIFGVSGAFARKWGSLALLLAGLLVCAWYQDSRIGYLGKLIAYPAALMVTGLFLQRPRGRSLESAAVLVLLASATAIAHSGMVTAMFMGVILGPYLVFRLAFSHEAISARWRESWQDGIILTLLIGAAVISTGIPARPVTVGAPDFVLSWKYILPRALDLEHPGANIHNLPDDHLPPLVYGREEKLVSGWDVKTLRRAAKAGCAIWICLACLAVVRRDPAASALLIGPMLLLIGLWWHNRAPEAFQLLGFLYPTALCGAGWLIDGLNWRQERTRFPIFAIATVVLAATFIGLRVPTYAGSLHRYAGQNMPKSQEFTKRQTERLVKAIGNQPVEVDITSLTHLLFVVIEIGGHEGVQLQWTPVSFESAFGYMRWPAPAYPPAKRKLILAGTDIPPGWRISFRARPFFLISAP